MLRPSHAIVIAPSRILNFRLNSSTIYTTWNMPASSLLYAYWSLGFTGHVQEAVIWCVLCSATSLISADDPQSSL